MLVRTDPLRELDRLAQRLAGANRALAPPLAMPMDACRCGQCLMIHFDIPGVDPGSIGLDVERDVLTMRAEFKTRREGVAYQVAERPRGVFSRQLFLDDTWDTDRIEACYDVGVLTLRIPIAEQAKPIAISGSRAPADRSVQA